MRRQWAPPMLAELSGGSRSGNMSRHGSQSEDASGAGKDGGQVISMRPAALIAPGVFVGSMSDAADALWRNNPLGVHAVVNCAQDEFMHQVRKGRVGTEGSTSWEELQRSLDNLEEAPQGGARCGKVMGLEYLGFCARDPIFATDGLEGHPPTSRAADRAYAISQHFAVTRAFVTEHLQLGHKVLIHCLRGENRSAAVCAAYLIAEHGLAVDQAIAHLREKRGEFALSNEVFVQELHKYGERIARERQEAEAASASPQPAGRKSPASDVSSKTPQSQACVLL
mmetsp:Transcript_38087/g.89200  ORF Transcript_38087/g.89200 Transcript_38087/m.89200 type:complete len:282 (+) Transcript_38087:174-1019(+)